MTEERRGRENGVGKRVREHRQKVMIVKEKIEETERGERERKKMTQKIKSKRRNYEK